MNWKECINSDKSVLHGKPTIRGTRISVEFLIELLAYGGSEQQILDNYPRITRADLHDIFAYIHDCMKDGLMFNIPGKSA